MMFQAMSANPPTIRYIDVHIRHIDVLDIEVNELDPDKFIDIAAALEPRFGRVNLGDIRASEWFKIERRLKERMDIPVFHDDQHGTAIISAAAIINALEIIAKGKA